jgi:PAS domain S-box-containing protein
LTHGSGLGLWLAHWIVTSHDGSINATSTEDGTTMTISLPRKTSSTIQHQLSKLTRARDQYQAAFEEANDAMLILNDDARIIDANSEASTIYGKGHQQLLGQRFQQFFPEEFDFEGCWHEFKQTGVNRETLTIIGADGVERQVECSVTSEIIPGQHLVVSRDITEQVAREVELRSKTQAMDEAPLGITLTDPGREDNPLVYANEQFRELTGYDEEEFLGRNCRFLQGEKTDPGVVATIRQAVDAQEPITEVIRNYRKDGTPFWNQLTISTVTDETGEVTKYIGFQQDVTDRIEREEALEQIETLFEHSHDGLLLIDVGEEFTVQRANPAYEAATGRLSAEIQGQTPREILGDEKGGAIERKWQECVDRREPVNYEMEVEIDGEPSVFEVRVAPVEIDGEVAHLVAAFRDVTERKTRERRYDAVFNNAYQFMGLLDPEGHLLEANEPALSFGGLTATEIIGEKFWKTPWFQHSDEVQEQVHEAVMRASEGEFIRTELTANGGDQTVLIDFSIRPVIDDTGEVTHLVPEGRSIEEVQATGRESRTALGPWG